MGVTQNSYIPCAWEVSGLGRYTPSTFKSNTSLALGILLLIHGQHSCSEASSIVSLTRLERHTNQWQLRH